MMAHDALGAHARDELGMSETTAARPLQAAMASALTFTVGSAAPLAVVPLVPMQTLVPAVALVSLLCLATLGALGARAGGALLGPSVLRVTFWVPSRWPSLPELESCSESLWDRKEPRTSGRMSALGRKQTPR